MTYCHVPVMLEEAVDLLNCRPGKTIVDGTLGGFGHAELICKKIHPNGIFIGIDQDIDAIRNAKKNMTNKTKKLYKSFIMHENFVSLSKLFQEINIALVDGILIDLGISLHQITKSKRGFSFLKDEPLDMRMNIQTKKTAAELLASLNEAEIADIFHNYGEERWAKKIARYLIQVRTTSPILTSKQLVNLVRKAVPKKHRHGKIHVATRVFMALRIAVNQELIILEQFLKSAMTLLRPTGRLCIITFHSLEDRIVKKTFKKFENPCTCPHDLPFCACNPSPTAAIITKKAIQPKKEEIWKNPMARSARLRAIEKI